MRVRSHHLTLLALALLAAFADSCKRPERVPPEVILRIGPRLVTLAHFKSYLERNAGTDISQIAPEASTALLDQFINELLLSAYASQSGIEVPAARVTAAVREDPGSTIEEKIDQLKREKLIAGLSAAIPEAAAEQIEAYYSEHLGEFRVGQRIRVRQILVMDEAVATQIAEQLRQGGSFEELSTKHSAAPNAARGGDIGYITRGQLPKVFEDAIFRLQPGQVSPVLRTDASFHIFRVDDRKPAGSISYDTAASVIRSKLKEIELDRQIEDSLRTAQTAAPVEVFTKRLPFRYGGTFPRTENE